VDKETGEAVCTFDELVDQKGGKKYEHKRNRVVSRDMRGGSNIRYGLAFKDHKLKKTSLRNVPIFYLRSSSEELNKLLAMMSYNREYISDEEYSLFNTLSESLAEQIEFLEQNQAPAIIIKKAEKFQKTIKEAASQKLEYLKAA
jgi:hypothetical protein